MGAPNRTEKVDRQRDGCKRLFRRQSRGECHPHGRIGKVAENSAMERAHWIGMLRTGLQRGNRASVANLSDPKANQFCDRRLRREYFFYQWVNNGGTIYRGSTMHHFLLNVETRPRLHLRQTAIHEQTRPGTSQASHLSALLLAPCEVRLAQVI